MPPADSRSGSYPIETHLALIRRDIEEIDPPSTATAKAAKGSSIRSRNSSWSPTGRFSLRAALWLGGGIVAPRQPWHSSSKRFWGCFINDRAEPAFRTASRRDARCDWRPITRAPSRLPGLFTIGRCGSPLTGV